LYHSPNFLDTSHICDISNLRVKFFMERSEINFTFLPNSFYNLHGMTDKANEK
jgi:hypothetical protein